MKNLSLLVAVGLFTLMGTATMVKAQMGDDVTDTSVQPSSDDVIIESTEEAETEPTISQTDECVDTDGDGIADDCDGDGKPDTDTQQ